MPEITQKLGFDASGANRNLTNLAKKLDQATASLANFQSRAGKTTGAKGVESVLSGAKKKANDLTVSWKTMARVIQTQIALRSFNLLIQTLKEGVESARQLGLAIEEIQTISGRGVGSSALTKDILNLSDAVGKSSQDIAEAYYQTLSNQVVEVGEALNFTSQAAKLATITASETKDAVNALSSVMNSYGFESSKAEYIAGTLFKTVELGRLRLSEMANVIGRVTPLTAAMGVEWEEAAAAIAVMTRQGVRADTAITQLRAVMTKMIRPTQEMRDIFHSWGVEDGKQAIETFGGLTGVLKKLAEETGHSSSEMADLLRRVRTIVGQLSIMTNEGEDVADAMEKIKGSSSELSEQWESFTQSDAFRLTKEMNRFQNTIVRLGTNTLPAVRVSLQAINNFVEIQALGWKVLLGHMDEVGVQTEVVRRLSQKAAEQIDLSNKWFSERQMKRYEGLTAAVSQYYAEAQKEEFVLDDIRDNAIDRANSRIKTQGKEIVDFYKNSVKSLEKFIDSVNDKIKSNTEKIADIQKDIESRQREAQLKGIEGNYRKIAFLEQELFAQREKFRDAFGDIDATKASRERALAEGEAAIELAKQALSLAEAEGHIRTIAKWEEAIQGLLINQQEVYKLNSKEIEKAIPKAKELYAEQKAGEQELQALIKQRADLFSAGALDAKSEERRRKAEAQLNDIDNRIREILTDASRSDEFLKSLGIEENFKKITIGLTEALNQSRKDWSLEVTAAKAAFADAIIPIKIALDPSGVKTAAAKLLELSEIEGEGVSTRARRIDEAAIAILKEQDQLQVDILNKRNQINTQLSVANRYLELGVEQSEKKFESIKAASGAVVRFSEHIRLSTASQEELNAALEKSVRNQQGYAIALERSLQIQLTNSAQGKLVTEQDIIALQQKLDLAVKTEQLTKKQAGQYDAIIQALDATKKKVQELNTLQAKVPEEAKVQAAKEVRNLMDQQKTAQEAGADAAKIMAERIQQGKQAMDKFKSSTDAAAQSTQNAANSVGDTLSKTSQLGASAAAQVSSVNALAAAYQRMAIAALAAARAQSAAGTATAYHGGPMRRHFADGGVVGRGQDKIITALSQGETVINAKQSKRFFSELNAMNQGSQPVFREQGGPVTNVGDVNITVNGGDSAPQTVRAIAHGLRRQFQRGNIKLH